MAHMTPKPWRVQGQLIEQPSWGGNYITILKGLATAPLWFGKKVGQSNELSKSSKLIDPNSGAERSITSLISEDADGFLGQKAIKKYGTDFILSIKMTQAKGNSFQVHLPEGKTHKHWKPKPEAWFYLAPGLYTFGLKSGMPFDEYAEVLRRIDKEMHRLSKDIVSGVIDIETGRKKAEDIIKEYEPYNYVNVIEANTDDVVDLTSGGIHHSWEEDDVRFPDGNLVYEVQMDIPDEDSSIRCFDKGKFLDNGEIRPTYLDDYLEAIINDPDHNELSRHIRRPQVIMENPVFREEAIFRTPYFNMDRVALVPGARYSQSVADGFHHLFIHAGSCQVGDFNMIRGQSYIMPASMQDYIIETSREAVILKTYLPV